MAFSRERTTSKGDRYYEIQVSRGRGKSRLFRRWYVPSGWSERAVQRELAKQCAEFERQCRSGEVISREEQKENDLLQKQEAAKIGTLKQYGEQVFMPMKEVTLAENTRDSYQGNLDHWIYPALGDFRLPDISAAEISALLFSMQSQGKALSTVLTVYTVLNLLFRMAYLTDVIDRNPMDKVERPKARKDELNKEGIKAYTAEEVAHILQVVDAEPLKWRAFVRLVADTGIRRGEACGLQWKYLNFKENTITIVGNLCYTKAKGVYLDNPKSGKTRTIDVDPEVMKLLRQLQAEQAETALSPYVFTQDGSAAPMHPQSPTRYFKKLGKKSGIEDFHPHKLRHTFASVAITNGADIASVSEKLGHSDKALTLRMYTHADAESMKRTSEIFRNAVKLAAQG